MQNSTKVTAAVCRIVHRLLQVYAEQYTGYCSCMQNGTHFTPVTNVNTRWQQ
jgi:hypothetical protein